MGWCCGRRGGIRWRWPRYVVGKAGSLASSALLLLSFGGYWIKASPAWVWQESSLPYTSSAMSSLCPKAEPPHILHGANPGRHRWSRFPHDCSPGFSPQRAKTCCGGRMSLDWLHCNVPRAAGWQGPSEHICPRQPSLTCLLSGERARTARAGISQTLSAGPNV